MIKWRAALVVSLIALALAGNGATPSAAPSSPGAIAASPSAASASPGAVAAPPSAASASPGAIAAPQLPRTELFTFHSDVFINFHHFLYRWAQVGPGSDPTGLDPRIQLQPGDIRRYEELEEAQRERWDVPAAAYRLGVIDRDLLFDDGMVNVRDCLVLAGNYCDRMGAADQALVELLAEYVGLYRSTFWSRHDAANRVWMETMIPLVSRYESEIARRLEAAYTGSWSDNRHRVDVTHYANRVGGYTTSDGHITVSSIDPGNQDLLGLELVFHEASHGETLEGPLRRLIRRSFDAIGAETPPDLWHMTIFYTAGHVTRVVLAEAGVSLPQTYAEYAGIFERREANVRAKAALDAHWKQALESGEGFRDAMAGVARAWEAWGR